MVANSGNVGHLKMMVLVSSDGASCAGWKTATIRLKRGFYNFFIFHYYTNSCFR